MQNSQITTCIIPAGGQGSRWAPISGYLPKEMLPLIDRPVIEWVIKEAINSGCKQIIVVINKQKKIIQEYLSKNSEINKKAIIHYIYQNEPFGIGPCIYLCKKFIGNKPFALAFPDNPTISHKPVLGQLIAAHAKIKEKANLISFDNFPPETSYLYSECLLEKRKDGLLKIVHFCPFSKPGQSHHPGNRLRMSGRYIFQPSTFSTIKYLLGKIASTDIKDDQILHREFELGHNIIGVQIQGHTYDTGNPINYIRANTAFFKKKLTK